MKCAPKTISWVSLIPRVRLWVLLSLLGALSCRESPSPKSAKPIVVFAASSLQEAFVQLERNFEARSPQWDVQLSFAGSQTLSLQISHGAQAAIFASANRAHLLELQKQGLNKEIYLFARNPLVLAVPLDSSFKDSFEALRQAQKIVVGTKEVPIGNYTQNLIAKAKALLGADFSNRLSQRIVSQETNVRLVRAKLALGEADLGIIYRSDLYGQSKLRALAPKPELEVIARYYLGIVKPQQAGAQELVDYLLSQEGQKILLAHGFAKNEG